MSDSSALTVREQRHALALQEVGTVASVVMAGAAAVQLLGALRPAEETRRTVYMAHSIVKAREAQRSMRRRIAHEVEKRQHTFAACLAAGLTGVYEAHNNKALPGFGGLDGTIVFGFGSLMAAEYVGGNGGKIAQSVADGLLSIGIYKYARVFTKQGLPQTAGGIGDVAADARAMDALLATG